MPNEITTLRRQTLEPATFAEAFEFAQALAKSSMVPGEYRGKPENILLAIQWGKELGLAPLQAIQNLAVINGKPSVYGDALIALVRGSPVCEDVIEGFEGTGDTLTAVCEARRRGKAPVRAMFGVADAKKAGLWGKSGPWQQYPRRMLQMRARGFALRDAFPDVLRGVITREEAEDYPVDIGRSREPIDVTPKNDLDAFAAGAPQLVTSAGEIVDEAAMIAAGDEAAELGPDGFAAWWNSAEIKPLRHGLRRHMERWRVIATAAAERGGPPPQDESDEDPFGLPSLPQDSPAGIEQTKGGGTTLDRPAGEAPAPAPDAPEPEQPDMLGRSDMVPLPKRSIGDMTAADWDYWARKMEAAIDEAPGNRQRLAGLKIKNEGALRRLKDVDFERYQALMRALAA